MYHLPPPHSFIVSHGRPGMDRHMDQFHKRGRESVPPSPSSAFFFASVNTAKKVCFSAFKNNPASSLMPHQPVSNLISQLRMGGRKINTLFPLFFFMLEIWASQTRAGGVSQTSLHHHHHHHKPICGTPELFPEIFLTERNPAFFMFLPLT